MQTVIRGASVLGETSADLLLQDGVIAEIGHVRDVPGAEVVDAAGLIALPGLVDLHTHLREPGKEDAETIESGCRAAAAGGFVAVCAMANTTPVTDTAERVEWIRDHARDALADVFPIGSVTRGLAGEELSDLQAMAAAGVRVFSDDGRCVMDSRLMREALLVLKEHDAVISQHSQDHSIAGPDACCHGGAFAERFGLPAWPAEAEEVIIARDVMLAERTGARVHVAHVSTPVGLDVIRWAKARGVPVTAEVTPHHLLLTTDLLEGHDPVYKVNPPLRPTEFAHALRDGLADGMIDIVATDHAPHLAADKQRSFVESAFGMLGLETALAVVATLMVSTGRMPWRDVARVMSAAPARIGRLPGHGSPLEVGAPAHVTLFDPAATTVVDREESASKSRNNPYHGLTLDGAVRATFRRGQRTF